VGVREVKEIKEVKETKESEEIANLSKFLKFPKLLTILSHYHFAKRLDITTSATSSCTFGKLYYLCTNICFYEYKNKKLYDYA
jgi:hypothetical protein